jgi:hypothetical protein
MNIIEKKWTYGTYKAYENVPADLLKFTPGCRVVPAPYAEDDEKFYLVAQYQPGENKYFPEGGYEVRGEGSMRHSFEIDQVIVWTDADKTTRKATVSRKTDDAKNKVRVRVTKTGEAPAAKNAAAPAAKKQAHVCGATKKDGTACQMRTAEGTRCRHHSK